MKKLLTLILIVSGLSASAQIGVYDGKPRYSILTTRDGVTIGNIEVELYPTIAPLHVRNWDSLVFEHFFDTTLFHRVVPGFVIQGGDPNTKHGPKSTWGFGQAWQKNIPAEFNPISHQRGIVSAARDADINSANSQFFICIAAATHLDGQYTAYGKVYNGMSIADNIVASPRDGNDIPNQNVAMYITRLADDTTKLATAVNIIQPANQATGISANYTFTWDALPGAIIYELEFSRDANFANIDTVIRTAKTSAVVPSLLPGEILYYWRILANNGGYKKPTTTRTFTTGTFPPTLQLPAQNAVLSTNQVDFSWDAVSSAGSYKIQIATNPNFTLASIQKEIDSINGTSISVKLTANKKHFWRVASEINGIAGAYSAARTVTTGAAVGIQNEKQNSISVYPNPTTDILFINSNTLPDTRYSILDTRGRTVLQGTVKENSIDVSNLKPGTYVLKTEMGTAKFNHIR